MMGRRADVKKGSLGATVSRPLWKRDKGKRIVSVEIGGETLDPKVTYKVAVTDFLATGGAGYLSLKKGVPATENTFSIRQALLEAAKPMDPKNVGSRITIEKTKK